MSRFKPISFRSLSIKLLALVLFCWPVTLTSSTFADDPSANTCTPPTYSTGVHKPVGADAVAYTYNCQTGLWQSAYYTYDPATGIYSPINQPVYTCDPATGLYDYTTYVWDAANNSYQPQALTATNPPAGADIVPCPVTQTSSPTMGGTNGDPSTINNTVNNNQAVNNQTGSTLDNTLNSSASSGNALINGTTTAGNATSGNAAVVASEMNLLQSSAAFGQAGSQPITFVSNINGNVNGDFLLDPASLSLVQPAASSSNTTINNNLQVNNTANSTLNNNLNLAAQSGNATINDNTTAGSATTGNATAVANLVNMINSAITAGQSFLGVVNINGNLNGDILLPANFVNQLVADNVPTVTVNVPNSNTTINNDSTVNNNNSQSINNTVNSTATSGAANITNNTNAGNATSGNAATHVTAFNLTGSQLIGSNDLLVFVNVLGKWVGLIVNAPPGATAAELGGGITTDNTVNNNSAINNNSSQQINNNINIKAGSGDATASNNTTVGNATTGNADTAVNLLNVENSSLSLANWFGVLFINVFGTWNGSFGINTSAGDPAPTSQSATGGVSSPTFSVPVMRFVPSSGGSGSGVPQIVYSGFGNNSGSSGNLPDNTSQSAVLASHVAKPSNQPTAPLLGGAHMNWLLALSGLSVCVFYVIGSRLYQLRHSH